MNHRTEEDLILHYYGELPDAEGCERHLEECGSCREAYGALQRALNVLDGCPVPERSADYEAEVWRRLERHLPARRFGMWRAALLWRRAAAVAVFASFLLAAFLAGRFSQPRRVVPAAATPRAGDPQAGERVLLAAVGDYLERSQRVFAELTNADPERPLNISAEQERATDLIGESRLYRQTAEHSGDDRVAGILDDLDRVLLEVAHAPSRLSPRELQELRRRLKAQGILFEIRVLDSNVRSREGNL